MSTRTRRGRWGAGVLAVVMGISLAGCSSNSGSSETSIDPDADPESVTGTVTVMTPSGELTEEMIAAFNKIYPQVKVTVLEEDALKLKALQAAGTPRTSGEPRGPPVPALVAQGQLLDLTEPLEAVGVDASTMFEASELYVVDGARYGVPKDWSPDFTIFVNNKLFEQAGIPVPDPAQPLSWEQVGELARQLTVASGATTSQFGLGGSWEILGPARTVGVAVAEAGEELYSADQKSIELTSNPHAMEALKFMADLAKDGVTHSPGNPSATWVGDEFMNGKVAMVNFGYWFNASLNSGETAVGTDYTLLPAPYWNDEDARIDPTVSATGWVMSSKTKNAQATFALLDWYVRGDQARERAEAGWGYPALREYVDLLPQDSAWNQQVYDVVKSEAEISPSITFDRYYDDISVFTDSYNKNLQEYIKGTITIDEFGSAIEADVDAAIADGAFAVE